MNISKERSCDIKKAYRNRKSANEALQAIVRHKRESRLQVYKCRYAPKDNPHFHVGHKRALETAVVT